MKVRELIELLKAVPQESMVLMESGSFQYQREVDELYTAEDGCIVLDEIR